MSLEHPLLRDCGVGHGFCTRDESGPPDLRRPRQVHGVRVVRAGDCPAPQPGSRIESGLAPEADAIVDASGVAAVAVVTADCVPVLVAEAGGRGVAAIHAGWRGLAAGVIEAGVAALRTELAAGRPGADESAPTLHAAIGPHIGPCCYEVDAPVLDALRHDHDALEQALREARSGHWWLDLGLLVRHRLRRAGVAADAIGGLDASCTRCDAERFHSYRRDGPRAGRLVSWIRSRPS